MTLARMAETVSDIEKAVVSQPMNVEQIVLKAQNYDYNPLIPLKYWLRTAGTLLKEVTITANLSQLHSLTQLEGRHIRA